MSTLEVKELSHPAGEVIKIAAGKTLDLHSQGTTKMPSGSILQVVNAGYSTHMTTSSSTYVDTGYQLSITPLYANSKMFITFSAHAYLNSGASDWNAVAFRILRDSTTVTGSDPQGGYAFGKYTASGQYQYVTYSKTYIDSPNTTNAVIYKPQVSAVGSVQINNSGGTEATQLIIMEIAQ